MQILDKCKYKNQANTLKNGIYMCVCVYIYTHIYKTKTFQKKKKKHEEEIDLVSKKETK